MSLLKKGISVIHFDETYFAQENLQKFRHDDINLQHLRHVNLFCEEGSLKALESNLKGRSQKGITFIGSGNYHYVSYLLLKEMTSPFTLILFDNHTDLGLEKKQDLLSCGSWVSYALLHNPFLQQVVIIGPTTISTHFAAPPHVTIYPNDEKGFYPINSILSIIQTQNVYISIDKDVLNADEVVTNWDQGKMKIKTLINYLQTLLNTRQVEGIDICGEVPISPINHFLPEYQTIIQKNEKANIEILRQCLNAPNDPATTA